MKKLLLFAVSLIATLHSDAQILLAQYNFDNDALDAVGNHHGTLTNGPTYTTDRFGNPNSAVFLDGIDDFIILANALTLQAGTYTYDLWVRPSSNPAAAQAKCILSLGGGTAGSGGDQVIANGGPTGWNCFGYQNPSGTYNMSSNVTPVVNQWYHITGTRDVTTATLYVNGVQVDNATYGAGTSPRYGQNLAYIGRRTQIGPVGPQFFHGAIDDLKIYSGVNIPLPLDLLSFNAKKQNGETILNWTTANMKNVAGFDIEKSTDAKTFSQIGFVKATDDNEYSFQDAHPSERNSFYRLKMMDIDGQFTYSTVVSLINNEKPAISIYPNPVFNELTIASSESNFRFQIADMYGRIIFNDISVENTKTISCHSLKSGIYFIKMELIGGTEIMKFIRD